MIDVSTTGKIFPFKFNIYHRDVYQGYTTVLMFKLLATHAICGTNQIFYPGTFIRTEMSLITLTIKTFVSYFVLFELETLLLEVSRVPFWHGES